MICIPTLKWRNPNALGENKQKKTLEILKRFSMPVSITSRTKTWTRLKRPLRCHIRLMPTGEKRFIWTQNKHIKGLIRPLVLCCRNDWLSPAGATLTYSFTFSPDLRTWSTAQSNEEHVVELHPIDAHARPGFESSPGLVPAPSLLNFTHLHIHGTVLLFGH